MQVSRVLFMLKFTTSSLKKNCVCNYWKCLGGDTQVNRSQKLLTALLWSCFITAHKGNIL